MKDAFSNAAIRVELFVAMDIPKVYSTHRTTPKPNLKTYKHLTKHVLTSFLKEFFEVDDQPNFT